MKKYYALLCVAILFLLLICFSKPSPVTLSVYPLSTDGKYIKNSLNKIVVFHGVWLAEYADSCVGAWGGDYFNWNEDNVRADMQNLRDVWHVNVIMTFIWGNWWLEDSAVTLGGYSTSHHYRFALTETARIAQEYGLYFQIRLWAPHRDEGRVSQPYAPYSSYWSQDDFVDFWRSVASVFKDYPNVIFTLYDEPTDDMDLWFQMASQAIEAIRAEGAENLIVVHWGYCGDCMWMEKWIQQGYPTENIVFSNHIYRFHGTFEYDPNSPTDVDYIRNFLARKPSENEYDGAAYKYITDTYNVPIWVSAIGAYRGFEDDSEYDYFKNTLSVLNEWGLSYCAYQWFRSDLPWYIGWHEPNRVGQALIDAIMDAAGNGGEDGENYGYIYVTATKNGADVVAEVSVGNLTDVYYTPFNLSLPVGSYFLKATYQDKSSTKYVIVLDGETQNVVFDFSVASSEPSQPPPNLIQMIINFINQIVNFLKGLFNAG